MAKESMPLPNDKAVPITIVIEGIGTFSNVVGYVLIMEEGDGVTLDTAYMIDNESMGRILMREALSVLDKETD